MPELHRRGFVDGEPAAVGHGAFAEFDRAFIGERQREGIELAKQRGAYPGRKRALVDNKVVELRRQAGAGEQNQRLRASSASVARCCINIRHNLVRL
jgi:DNA invertase Pin-like site-specific DNA recombinase